MPLQAGSHCSDALNFSSQYCSHSFCRAEHDGPAAAAGSVNQMQQPIRASGAISLERRLSPRLTDYQGELDKCMDNPAAAEVFFIDLVPAVAGAAIKAAAISPANILDVIIVIPPRTSPRKGGYLNENQVSLNFKSLARRAYRECSLRVVPR
jgi:hypothetical protein